MVISTKRFAQVALVLGLIVVAGGLARADIVVDATFSSGGNSTFGTLDLTTGQFSSLTTLSVTVVGLTSSPNGTLYGGALDGNLYTISSTGVVTQFGTVQVPSFSAWPMQEQVASTGLT